MSLKFVFGPSGAGKSRQIYEEIINRAGEERQKNFFIIVPDQFTMQTQKDLVLLSDRGGIMNIDVLSFGRLNHRIMEEVGGGDIPVLDDTGKSLVLQRIAGNLKDELPVLGSFLSRQGYIHEVKSAISEFMQYGIGVEDVDRLIDFAEKRGALVQKLKDLQTLYRGFREYIQGNFITTEETLDVLCRSLSKSRLLPGSVVVFDGFTGFTPIQNRVVQELMRLCEEVIVTVTLGEGENPYETDGEQRLFHLSRKTVADLSRLAEAAGVQRGMDIFVLSGDICVEKKWEEGMKGRCSIVLRHRHRYEEAPALRHLERNLFRYSVQPYRQEQQEIRIFETTTPRDEVHQTGLMIRELVREKALAYRDIAVITGDLAGYAPYVETEFVQMEIPFFLDRTRGIVLNPMVEYIKSALELYLKDFSYEAVFHYLRSGLADMEQSEVDVLENYVIRTGIRGFRRYSRLFTHKTAEMGEDEEELAVLNELRERFLAQVEMLHMEPREPVRHYVDKLYDFLTQAGVQNKLAAYEAEFESGGQLSRAREYAQIYRLIMELLEQIYELLGEEEISLQEFADILEAGFGEIQVGTIPQNVDRVVVGDMERTRLKQVKALFFLGVNDGNIPKSVSKGGIISDMDREFLRESQVELAPSPRQQMFIQRLYLYLNMTKPSERLYLAYSKVNSAGKSMRPAYLIGTVKNLFPDIRTEYPELRSPMEQIVTAQEGAGYLAAGLREYAAGVLSREKEREVFTIYQAFEDEKLCQERDFLRAAAFRRYRDSGLSAVVAEALYGKYLENSVSRLETYAACAYRHFLQYGLTLQERQEFSFENVDMGNVYHGVLELFAGKLEEQHYTWFDFPEEFAAAAVQEALEFYAASYGDTVLYSSARNRYALTRMGRILTRTVLTLQRQLKKGSFRPDAYELSFRFTEDLESVNVRLSEQEKMRLQGRIDRIDVAEDADRIYVKVVDYKSGDRHFDLAALYYGLQLQLVVYMNAALEVEAKKHPDKEIVPAALLYYHISDPAVESPVELSEEELEEQIGAQLRMKGIVSSDPGIVERLDAGNWSKSDVIPVERKKDGTFSVRSSMLTGQELKTVSDYVSEKVAGTGREILDGKISLNPYEMGNEEACTWCAFKRVCGFETSLPGCEKRKLDDMGSREALERMRS
ncbi:MAG: helicase-exonuclease AddAB subunit AddB [Butyrivibrio sp.]|nr:helicase-exonuclease AddAB subunit AddB [Acetatifactor muris]MCM1559007.1 helicase-exonuclease AddAB subunit AddB [Butyrivibrio sp.]